MANRLSSAECNFAVLRRASWWVVLAAILAAGLPRAGNTAETCWTEGPSQFVDAMHYCVSSVLPPQGRWSYGPKKLVGYVGELGAWCEGAPGPGIGQAITLRIERGPAFRRLLIRNGYGKSAKSFAENGRIRTLRITSDTGIDTMVKLADQAGLQPVYLPLVARHRWVRLEIRDVYPGARFADTCVSAVAPDFEYEEQLLQKRQRQGRPPPPPRAAPPPISNPSEAEAPPPALPPPPPQAPPPTTAPGGGDQFEELPDLPR